MGDGKITPNSLRAILMNALGPTVDDPDDGLTPENSPRQSPQPAEPSSGWPQAPTKDPMVIRANGREILINEIDADIDACWAHEEKWDQLQKAKMSRALDTDLAIYVCSPMLDAKAAAALAKTNEKKGEYYPPCRLPQPKGDTDAHQGPSQGAFWAQRDSRGDEQKALPDDGNKPLHDAVDFDQHFLMPGPECKIPEVAGKESRSSADSASTMSGAKAAGRGGLPAHRSGRPHSHESTNPGRGAASRQYRLKLLTRYGKALVIHNSAGLSPYLCLLTASQASTIARPEEAVEAAAAAAAVPGLNRQTTLDGAGLSGTAGDAAEKSQPGQRPSQGQVGGSAHAREGRNAPGEKEPVNNIPPKYRTHDDGDLKAAHTESKSILTGLLFNTSWLGGYNEACKCLFPGQGSRNPSHRSRWKYHVASGIEKGHANRLLLSTYQESLDANAAFPSRHPSESQDDTTDNYSFLQFGPMMVDVSLNLEYSQKDMKSLSSDEKKMLETWRQDQANLVEFFRWLCEGKRRDEHPV
ncbi:hypothetical protein MAPG_10479 [Magnaporthiopsis poae ATCC 64411]|uniref:Uncharacterized protein n=1 Tax=Magnaporthiopsis poae (strain ATCC 64411 / 73-15) TaxID=644358 RepID=A0A0C4ECP7_MAGP6|nr:hypothetical protein MAPG_10479 [Magnaporthiopsis poae ATCC 64411]